MKQFTPFILAICIALPAMSDTPDNDGWSCRNHDAEISCSAGGCNIEEEAFTPMDISVSDTEISACAYSGCWEGAPTTVSRTGDFVTYTGSQLAWIGTYESAIDLTVTIDAQDQTGTIIVRSLYAMPLTCEPRAGAASAD